MTRQEANLEICKHLTDFFSNPKHADYRFWQGIYNLGIINGNFVPKEQITIIRDEYNLESVKTLHKLRVV